MSEKKSGFSLKNLFIAEDPEIKTPVESPKPNIISPKIVNPEKEPSKTKQILIDVLREEGLKKIGYIQYKQSLEALESIISDEKIRFTSAFAVSSKLGLTKENLLLTIEESKKTLEKEKIRFDSNVGTELEAELKGNANEVASLTESIANKTEELQNLTQEITELQKKKKEAEDYIQSKQIKVEKLKEDFNISYTEIYSDLDSDLSKIKNYLV